MKASVKTQKMNFTVIVTVVALSLIIVLPAKAINWGLPDGTLHPNVGAMVVQWSDGTLSQGCSGTLIYPNIFLTAGHCTDWVQHDMASGQITAIYVNFNEDALDEIALLPVAEVFTHPKYYAYRPRSNNYDVGLLILEEAVEGITPATLPEEGFLDARKKAGELREGKEEVDFTVVGYGTTLEWPPPKRTSENMRRYAFSEYQALLKSWLIMSQNAATDDGGTGYGDSGGPTFWIDPETGETDIVVAITSWGDAPTVATGIAYRIDTSDTLDFIAEVADDWLEEP